MSFRFVKNAQASLEFIILLAVGMILLAVIVFIIVDFPSGSGTTRSFLKNEQYAQESVAITDYRVAEDGRYVQIANNRADNVYVTAIQVNNANISLLFSPVTVRAGSVGLLTEYTNLTSDYTDTVKAFYCVGNCSSTAVTQSRIFSGTKTKPYFNVLMDAQEMLHDRTLAHVRLNEESFDASRYGNPIRGSVDGATSGIFGNASIFGKSTNYLHLSTNQSHVHLHGDQQFTVLYILKFASGYDAEFFSKKNGTTSGFSISTRGDIADKFLALNMYNGGNTCLMNFDLTNELDFDKYSLLAFSFNGTGKTIRAFMGGTAYPAQTITNCTGTQTWFANITDGQMYVGRGFGQDYPLTIDEFLLLNVSLSPDNIDALYERMLR